MAKQGTRVEVNTFVKGLITEASPLNFPPNASLDEVNFVLNRNGTRNRRLGMDLEVGYSLQDAQTLNEDGRNTNKINTYVWNNVGGDSSKEFLVVQTGGSLKFHDLRNRPFSPLISGDILTIFSPSQMFSFASINGSLVVAGGGAVVAVITYKDSIFNLEYYNLKSRDVWGVQEEEIEMEEDPSYQPTTVTNSHLYNLANQSWGIPRRKDGGLLVNPASYYAQLNAKLPSSTEVVWTGLAYQPVVGVADPYERMYANLYTDRLGSDVIAAKGYFIIDIMQRGSGRSSAVAKNTNKYPEIVIPGSYKLDYSTQGPTSVCEYAGRMFYAGFGGDVVSGDKRSPSFSNYIFFTQLVKHNTDLVKCYQEGDPTSRDNSDVVETDGGFVRISGVNKIVAMCELGSRLIVFADNGVWALSGGSDYGFSATNYKVQKLSTYGCVSVTSIVAMNEAVMYWGQGGIYAVSPNQYGEIVVEDATATTIQTLYLGISDYAKRNASGIYDPNSRKIHWVYRTGDRFTPQSITRELVFDVTLKSFYQHQIAKAGNNLIEVQAVFMPVLYFKEPVYIAVMLSLFGTVSYSFSGYRNTEFIDFKSFDGIGADAKAYLLTGALTGGDSGIAKQAPYLTMHFERTEEGTDVNAIPLKQSSCLMRAQWEWANTVNSKKFSSLAETYKYRLARVANPSSDYDNGFETIITKNKLRGRGKAISLYFETSPLKDCRILGWNLTLNGNAIS